MNDAMELMAPVRFRDLYLILATATVRAWYEADTEMAQRFYESKLGFDGVAPRECEQR